MSKKSLLALSIVTLVIVVAAVISSQSRAPKSGTEKQQLFPDLYRFEATPAGALSGGQQQMVAVARALMLDPRMLIMDEPSLGLSPRLVKHVMSAVRRVAETRLPILLVEQNVKQVLRVSDRAYVLENGRLVLEGCSRELEGHPAIKKAYLGV